MRRYSFFFINKYILENKFLVFLKINYHFLKHTEIKKIFAVELGCFLLLNLE